MENDSSDLFIIIGKLYNDLYRSQTMFVQLRKQIQEDQLEIKKLKEELNKHMKVIPIPNAQN